MDHVKKGAIKDNDLLFRVDLDDSQIRKIYSDVNSEEFIYNGAKEKFESGGYQKTFGFGKTDDKGKYLWDELSSDQQDALIKHYNDNEIKSFNDTFSGEKTSGMWPFKKKTELTGEMDLKAARQRYIRKQGFTPNEKQYNKNFNKLFEQDAQLASAYRDYYSKAKSIYDAGKSTAVPTMDEFFSDGKRILTTDQIESLKSVIGDGMGKSGIKAATKFKGLKVAGAIAAGMTALWGLSEMYDED